MHAPTLVLAQEDDPAHPVWVAEHLAQALPAARLEVLPAGGIMWRHRKTVRDLIGAFLSEGAAAREAHMAADGRPTSDT